MAVNSGVEHADAARAEQAVLKELADLCDGPITDEELEDCRRGLLAGMNGLEDTLGGIETWYYMEVLRGGPVQTPDDARRALLAVTGGCAGYSEAVHPVGELSADAGGGEREWLRTPGACWNAPPRTSGKFCLGLTVLVRPLPATPAPMSSTPPASAPSTGISGWGSGKCICPPVWPIPRAQDV